MIINKYSKNVLISTLPGFLAILLSFFSIPIFLQNLGLDKYGNYLILHIILSITLVTNFNLGKIASIRMQKVSKDEKEKIIYTTLILSFVSSLFVTIIFFGVVSYIKTIFNFDFFIDIKYLYFSIFLSNIYITLENLSKANKFFLLSGISNLIFYSLSISAPSFVFFFEIKYFNNPINLFIISFYLKLTGVFLLLIFLIYKKLIITKISKIIIDDFKNIVKWQTLSSIYNQIFKFIDKYIIKIILGSASLTIYSIPQQIAEKLSIISEGIISVLLPKIASKKNSTNRNFIFSSNLYVFFYSIGFFIIIFASIFDDMIIWWLEIGTGNQIIFLFKIFIITSYYECMTYIISTYYDTRFQSKKNTQIDTLVLLIFLVGLIVAIKYNNLNYFAFTLLFKSLLLFCLKINYIKKDIINLKTFLLQNFIFLITFLSAILELYYFYILTCFLFLIIMIFTVPYRLLKKEFLK